jgi:regulator of sigma E protease
MSMVRDLLDWLPVGLPAFLFVITLVVFFHELGHFLVARACGVKVETFSIGFGRAIFGWHDRKGTYWKVSWIPFGGYVKFFGDLDAASTPDHEQLGGMTSEERSVAFPYKPMWQRAAVVAAGPVANFILAIVIFAGTFMAVGQDVIAPVVDAVRAGSPAQAAGIKAGDVIRAIDGQQITSFADLTEIVSLDPGRPLAITLSRGPQTLTVHATPKMTVVPDYFGGTARSMILGLSNYRNRGEVTVVRYGPIGAVSEATKQTWTICRSTLTYLWQMITGYSDTSQLRGPLGMANVSKKVASVSFVALINLAALISVSIGLINLFPIPLLDGGHLLYYAFEAVLGRPLGVRAQDVGFRLGLALVLGLMILATWNDIARLNLF